MTGTGDAAFSRYGATNISVSGGVVSHNGGTMVLGHTVSGRKTNITVTGGALSAKALDFLTGTINVSGGSFAIATNFVLQDSGSQARTLKVTGGKGSVSIGGNMTYTAGPTFKREFVLTADNAGLAQENISKITVVGTDSAGGDVDVNLEGGILLANPTEYTLISAGTLSATPNYTGTGLYTGAADGNNYKITLDSSLTQGDLTIVAESAPVSESFDLTAVGYLNTDFSAILGANTSLRVRLDVGTGAGSMEDLVTYLSNSGYSDFALESVGDYDIAFTVSNDYLSDGMMYFGWDLTDFANGAGLMGVEVTAVPEPNAIWLLSAAGFSLLLWRRRGSLLARRAA